MKSLKSLEALVLATAISCSRTNTDNTYIIEDDTFDTTSDTRIDTGIDTGYRDNPPIIKSFEATENPISNTNSEVTFEAYITDNERVVLAYTELNGVINIMTGSDPYTTSYSIGNVPLGENIVTVTAYDSLSQTTSAITTFTVYDAIPPTITDITVYPNTIYVLDEDPFTISATITDDVAVVSASVTIDSIEETLTDDDGDNVYKAMFTINQFEAGTYTATILASDGKNTTEESAELTILEGSTRLENYIACYDFENNLDDITGTYNATSSGSPTYTLGVTGYAVDMTRVNAVINTGIDINPTDGFSITGWGYLNEGACSNSCNLWDTWHDEGTHELALFTGGSDYNGKLRFLIEPNGGGSDEQLDSLTDVANLQGAWHHIATTFSNDYDTQVIYIDGVADNSRTISVDNHDASKQIWLGQYGSSGQWFSGLFDTVIVYETSLLEDEIGFLYNSGNGRSCF